MSIRFEIFRDGQKLSEFTPVGAMAMGPDSVPVPGEVVFREGVLRTGITEQATGIALLWDCGPLGVFHLETTRLLPRHKPYVLNVELARARLMKCLHRLEDWGLIEHPDTADIVHRLRAQQIRLADAFVLADDPAAASRIADEVLTAAIPIGEELAVIASSLALIRRQQHNSFARYVLGCRVDWTMRSQRVKDLFVEHFDYAVVPLTWRSIQPAEDAFETAALDEWIDHLFQKRVPIIAGPIIDLSEGSLPDWAYIWETDFDVMRDLMIDFVRRLVTRYRKAVAVWNVVGGLHASSLPGLSFEQTIELTRLLVAQVKAMLPQARTLVTIRDPFGEHHAKTPPGVPPMLYAETVAQAGINCDGFGLEIATGIPKVGGHTRDLLQFSSMLDRICSLGKPVYLTSIAAPSRNNPDPADASEGRLDPSRAGRLREPWSHGVQQQWAESFYRIALGKPSVESLTWADFTDANASVPGGGLLDDMLKPKPLLETLKGLRQLCTRREKKSAT